MTHESAIPPEDLLAQLPWLRALSRRLARDPGRAEDLAQEACVRALERVEPLGPVPLRAWLAGLLRRLALDRVRADGRRGHREVVAAQSEALPSAAEVASDRARLRRVALAVAELDEPYRTAVLLRYVAQLDAPEIAERTGASPAAVRQRLSRAYGMLRARLSEGGSRWGMLTWLSRFLGPRTIWKGTTVLKLASPIVLAGLLFPVLTTADQDHGDESVATVEEATPCQAGAGLALADCRDCHTDPHKPKPRERKRTRRRKRQRPLPLPPSPHGKGVTNCAACHKFAEKVIDEVIDEVINTALEERYEVLALLR